jgi:hypothetical protein
VRGHLRRGLIHSASPACVPKEDLRQFPTKKTQLVVPLPPMFSVANRRAFST